LFYLYLTAAIIRSQQSRRECIWWCARPQGQSGCHTQCSFCPQPIQASLLLAKHHREEYWKGSYTVYRITTEWKLHAIIYIISASLAIRI